MLLNYKFLKIKSHAGFSLVEILMVIGIMLIILTISSSGLQDYQRYQFHQAFVGDIRNGLYEARAKTIGSIDGNTYGVYIGTNTVEFFEGTTPVVGAGANTILEFSGGIYATSSLSTGNWYFNFARITGEASAVGTIDIVDTVSGETTSLTINSTGLVQ